MMFDIGADLQRAYDDGIAYAWEVAQKVFNSTVTFYEAEDVAKQIDKDINVRSKDEPQKDCKKCKNYDRCKNNRWKCCVYEPKDEPQTMYYPQVDGITPSVIVKDEPQTDYKKWDAPPKVKLPTGEITTCVSVLAAAFEEASAFEDKLQMERSE